MFSLTLFPRANIQNIDDVPPIVNGRILTFRGIDYDFSAVAEGDVIEKGLPFISPVSVANGAIICTLEYLFSTATAEPQQSANWDDYKFDLASGQCPCPIKRKPVSVAIVEVTDE